MKRILVSAGVVALGVTAVHADSAAAMTMGDNTKPWSVSATLRGFYDDNYVTAPDDSKADSLGFTVSPSIAFKLPLDQTTLGLRYTYGATWYEDRASMNSDNNAWDQSHEIEALLSHSFSPRYSLDISDSFVVAQEPSLLNDIGSPYRTEGNNIRNHGEITFNGALTKQLAFVLGYQNTFYDYENSGATISAGPTVNPSLSGLLDRIEHEALVNLRWLALPKTTLVAGYNYRQVDYTSDELVAFTINGPQTSETRNNRSHIVYGGFDQNFSRSLALLVRGGVQMSDYYNDPLADQETSPWANLSLRYNYLPGSNFQLGVYHRRNQTDVVTPDASGRITSDQESTVVFANVDHRFTPKLSGRVNVQWQDSEFFGGLYDGISDKFWNAGASLTYQFNNHLSGSAGYTFSTLDSDIDGRGYDRNYVFVGVTAWY